MKEGGLRWKVGGGHVSGQQVRGRETDRLQLKRAEGVFLSFWFRSGRGCGPGPHRHRGGPPPYGRASCASCAPSCPCGGGAGGGRLAELARGRQRGRRNIYQSPQEERLM